MSVSDRNPTPDTAAFRELEQLVRHLVDELAGFRRRALQAEARLRQLESAATSATSHAAPDGPGPLGHDLGADEGRLSELATENAQLRARLAQATDRTRRMLDRVRFHRQQHVIGGEK